MYNISLRLTINSWHEDGYLVDVDDIVLAYVSAMRTVKRRLLTGRVDLLALGDDQYIIWAYGKCQGLMVIKAVGHTTLVPDSGNGQ